MFDIGGKIVFRGCQKIGAMMYVRASRTVLSETLASGVDGIVLYKKERFSLPEIRYVESEMAAKMNTG